ncbi:MAG TPA: glycosyltransferase family 4 protein [Candidatus Deferrimicrobium sp.]|nr:glycosyltransferase family 4 protein [Candidatus Deferrimicrobium sp.]
MKIVWFTPELGNFSSGIVNHNRIFINYLHNHPDVQQIDVVKYPFPEDKRTPPAVQDIGGIRYYTPRISLPYHDAFKSILQADLKCLERLKIHLMKLALRFKGIKTLDLEQIKQWGKVEYGLLGIASVQKPFPNPIQTQIGKFIAQLQPDIIQSHVEMFSIAGSIAKEVAKGHISYQIIVEEEREALPPRSLMSAFWDRIDEALQWLIEQQAVDRYVAASEYVKTRLMTRGITKDLIHVIPSPVVIRDLTPINKEEARSRLGIPQNKRVLLTVGRVVERKRIVDIIRILKDLPDDVILYFKRSVSSSDYILPSGLNSLLKEIRKAKLEKRVIINSEVLPYERMHEIYSAADIAIFPFLYEPFGMCAAEAMAVGRPLIVYDSGYLPNFVNGNGFTVKPLDLQALREKVEILLRDPSLADEMGAKGRILVKQYDINVLGERLLKIYQEFVK